LTVVNNRLGHEQGDELQRRAAKLILSSGWGSDVVAMMGGGELAVVLRQTDQNAAEEVTRYIIESAERDTAQHP